MKTRRFFVSAAIAALATMGCGGCANNQPSATSANANPAAKTYTANDLQKTGKRTSGEALQAADSSVTAREGR